MIKIRNLNVSMNNNDILENINLDIPLETVTAIVGQSGSGKTVLVKTIEGLIDASSGTIEVLGNNIPDLSKRRLMELRKNISMLFQESALFDSMNVYQNVALPLFEHTDLSENKILELVKEKLELVGLKGILEKYPSELSGGMKKRVGLARAIVMNPKCIIYDEPTTGLDPIIADDIINLINKLQNSFKLTSIIITHDMECVRSTADKIVMLRKGQIIFKGVPEGFFNSSDSYIKRFIKHKL